MSKPVAVLFADSHLQDRAWANRPILGDAYYAFEQIIDYAIEHELEIVGAGDLIDKQRNAAAPIVFLSEQLRSLEEAGGTFYYVQGQHEFDDVPWMGLSPRTRHVHGLPFDLRGITCYGLDFQPAGQLQDRLGKIPTGVDLLFAHQVWGDLMGSIANPQGGFHDVPVVSHMITGDLHKHEKHKARGRDGQELVVYSPGSTCKQSIEEPDEHYFLILYDDLTFKRVKLKSRPSTERLLSREADVEQFLAEIGTELQALRATAEDAQMPEHICRPLLRVTYSSRIAEAARRIIRAVGDDAHLFLKELPPTVEVSTEGVRWEIKRDGALTLETGLPDYLGGEGMDDLYDPCLRLLQATDVTAEMRRMREEALGDDEENGEEEESDPQEQAVAGGEDGREDD